MKNPPKVLDSYSIIAYLENEAGARHLVELFKDARDSGRELLLCMVNWGEVYYITHRELGREKAEEISALLTSLPIEIVSIDLEMTKTAAELKSQHRMSYADCFAAALAKTRGGEVVTGDAEFQQVEKEIPIHWIVR